MSNIKDRDVNPFSKEPPLINLGELKEWIIEEDDDLLVINKPGWVVCHPSKNGPFSSLVSACREYTGLDRLHLISRLDRETSGLVILAKHKSMASICQKAIESREVQKNYVVFLTGELKKEILVDQPLARDMDSPVFVKQMVREDRTAQKAQTIFKPLYSKNNYTIAGVELITGRKHQIRAHAKWLGHDVVGDKIYGPDDTLYLEFIEKGWTSRLEENLPIKRQALHAAKLVFNTDNFKRTFFAPLPEDLTAFAEQRMGLSAGALEKLLQ